MEITVPLIAEQLHVEVQRVAGDRVYVSTRVVETEKVIEQSLQKDEVQIQRVSINRQVEHTVPPRQDGDVTIVPVYEEVLVVTRQLVLKEELHIRKSSVIAPAQRQAFTLRHEEVTVTRIPPNGSGKAGGLEPEVK